MKGIAHARRLSWGLVDQVASSTTNLGLTVLAGRTLGPHGLGIVAIGFSIYVAALGLQRALFSDALVISSATKGQNEARSRSQAAVAMVLAYGCTLAIVVATLGVVLPGAAGRALLLFAPWLAPALVQDLWRSILFRDGRGGAAAANDAFWLLIMFVGVALTWSWRSDWLIVGAWGLGATSGALLGLVQTKLRPVRILRALRWWRNEIWSLSRWFVAENIAYTSAGQGTLLVIAGILGPASLGGFRAVQSIFAPLSLLGPALALPLLPHLSRLYEANPWRARRVAVQVGLGTAVLTSLYLAALGWHGRQILGAFFGRSFSDYAFLILPVGLQQVINSTMIGLLLLLKANRRGRAFLFAGASVPILALSIVSVSAALAGLRGVAWGYVATAVIGGVLVTLLAPRHAPPDPEEERPSFKVIVGG
jgi:O-antigen/teichoic acid export membrane protein